MLRETSPFPETAFPPKTLGDVVTSHTQPKSLMLPETGSSASEQEAAPAHLSPITLFMDGYGLHISFVHTDVSSHHFLDMLQSARASCTDSPTKLLCGKRGSAFLSGM